MILAGFWCSEIVEGEEVNISNLTERGMRKHLMPSLAVS